MHSEGCLICGEELVYSEKKEKAVCSVCGKDFISDVRCPKGHFVCDRCHEAPAKVVIVEICLGSEIRDPIELAIGIMKDPSVNMHGPEHHLLVGCVLATAYHNCGGDIDLPAAIIRICDRMSAVPGGVCGNYGCCGSAVSAGTFISVLTGATPLTEGSWGMSNLMTSKCLAAIAEVGGPRCCKRDSFLTLMTASKFITEKLGVEMKCEVPTCTFHERNRQCLGKRCPFHP